MKTYWLAGRLSEMTSDIEEDTDRRAYKLEDMPDIPGEIMSGDNLASVSHAMASGPSRAETRGDLHNQEDFPGEIQTIESPTYSAALQYPMPGRPAQRSKSILKSSQKANTEENNTTKSSEHTKST